MRDAKRNTIGMLILGGALLLAAVGCDERDSLSGAAATIVQKSDARSGLAMNHNETLLSEDDQARDQDPRCGH